MRRRKKFRSKLTDQRKRKIQARLKEGYTEQDLCDAIDGIEYSAHHRGENDEGRVWDELTLICRDGAHVEMLRDLKRSGGSRGPPSKRDDVATDADFSDQALYGRRMQN